MNEIEIRRSRGRPSGFKKAYCKMLVEHMRQGLSFEAFAGKIGKCEKTLFNWLELYPDFLQSKKEGTAAARLFWERMGIEGISGNIQGFNATTWIFNMKNRFGWRDRHDLEHSASGNAQLQVQVIMNSPNPFGKRSIAGGESPVLEANTAPIVAIEQKAEVNLPACRRAPLLVAGV